MVFRLVVGWAGKYRKEIELSTQKTQNGILPTPYSALKTGSGLRNQMGDQEAKSPVWRPGCGFAFVTLT